MPADLIPQLIALGQVVLVDLTLAGDNAIVVGLAVAGLPAKQQRPAILAGIGAATVIRVVLGAVTLELLAVVGLLLAGGVLLLWVCWKMFRELRHGGHAGVTIQKKSMREAILQIVLADLSMSLDNVLAVAGAAHGHVWVLVVGLSLSVVMMGVAAGLIAGLLARHRWIAWVGLSIVFVIALRLIWDGSQQVFDSLPASGHTSLRGA